MIHWFKWQAFPCKWRHYIRKSSGPKIGIGRFALIPALPRICHLLLINFFLVSRPWLYILWSESIGLGGFHAILAPGLEELASLEMHSKGTRKMSLQGNDAKAANSQISHSFPLKGQPKVRQKKRLDWPLEGEAWWLLTSPSYNLQRIHQSCLCNLMHHTMT